MTRILVTGATGRQGGAVARHLARAGFEVRGLTRSPEGAAAKALEASGIEVVSGDLEIPESLAGPLTDVHGVFSVQDFYAPNVGFEGEVRQGRHLIDQAARQGVEHFVQSTMATAEGAHHVPHFQSKFAIERHLEASGLTHTQLGTVWFMDNIFDPAMGGRMTFPLLAGMLSPATQFEMLAVDDIGAIATKVFEQPERFAGQKLDMAGDRRTVSEMKATYRAVIGRRPPPLFVPRWLARRLAPEFAAQLAWHDTIGWRFPLEPVRALWPRMQTFRDFLERRAAAAPDVAQRT